MKSYICGCEKGYTTYPSFFVHVKRKHGGVKPSGTRETNRRQVKQTNYVEEQLKKDIDVQELLFYQKICELKGTEYIASWKRMGFL